MKNKDKDYTKVFQSNFSKLKTETGISLRTLANKVDIHHATLHRFILGTNMPSMVDLIKLAQYFNVTLSWFTGYKRIKKTDNLKNDLR
jgi:transcriptional regulator with XRE-family HTH domain